MTDKSHNNSQPDSAEAALEAGIRAAKLALFVINKAGVMPNHSWEGGFKDDLAKAEAGLAALRAAPAQCGVQNGGALRALADLFSESAHETWTKDEIVNVIEDAIRIGSPVSSADRGGG